MREPLGGINFALPPNFFVQIERGVRGVQLIAGLGIVEPSKKRSTSSWVRF